MLPCLIFEDDHLLAVNKPAGLNTHAPSPYAGEGLYDWLRHRESRWASLAIIHRLDKETSGVIVFSKTALASRSLTEQFTRRTVRKKYLLVTDRTVPQKELIVRSSLARAGEKYVSRSRHAGGEPAETRFRPLGAADSQRVPSALDFGPWTLDLSHCAVFEAEPLTGRTHQIRVHAAEQGFPILGDTLYGGTAAPRVYLHAAEITLTHPAAGHEMTFRAAPDFAADPRLQLRDALIEPELTDAFCLIHGASDGWPGWHVERLGNYLLSESEQPLALAQSQELARLMKTVAARGAYHKLLSRRLRGLSPAEAAPQLVLGEAAPERFVIRENGPQFELSFIEGYSVGLFLDQRDNRRRLLTGQIVGQACRLSLYDLSANSGDRRDACSTVLNAFAYTCAFSVCAAKAGARVTSLDLSKKYLAWGRRNFTLNQLDPDQHEFICGDVFDWLRRLAKKRRRFDCILLDPPTFSQSKQSGVFRAEKDYGKLVAAALPLLKAGGALFASSNAADWLPEEFLGCVVRGIQAAKRQVLQHHYFPQPPDFPISRSQPAYLKTVWLRVA